MQTKEVLFDYVIEEYISSRRQHLVRLFLDALTVGGPGGTPRPIEMHAHDPTRLALGIFLLCAFDKLGHLVRKHFY
jgi:hypothetical protein